MPVWLWAALAVMLADPVLDALVPLSRAPGRKLIDYAALEAFCLLGIWMFGVAKGRPDLPAGAKKLLGWSRTALIVQALGGLMLIIMFVSRALNPGGQTAEVMSIVANVFFMLSSAFLIVGLLGMGRASNVMRTRARSAVDPLTFIVGTGVPYWLFSVRPLLGSPSIIEDAFTVLFPVESFFGLLVLSWSLETRTPLPSRPAVRLLLVGMGLVWVTDVIFSIGQASGIPRGVLIDVANLITGVALCFWLVAGWRFSVDPYNDHDRRPLVEFSPLPLITIVAEVGFVVVLVLFRDPDPHLYPKLLISFFPFLGILLAREFFVIRDSLRLVSVEARQRSQARFEALVRYASDAVVVVDDRRIIRFASFASRGVLGVSPESMVGTDLLSLVHAEDKAEASTFFDKLILNPKEVGTIQWRLAEADGSVRHLETAGSNLLGEPDIEGIVLNTRDVSERTQLQEQLHRVARMEAVGRLAGSVAHDFNNLLAVILTNADLASSELDDRNTPESDSVRQDIDEIRRAAARGATLTNRLLAFTRTEVVKPRAIPVEELIRDAVPMLQRTVGPTVNVVTSVRQGCGALKVNPDDFIQALINLGSNARDAMPEGGTLTIAVEPAKVEGRLPGSYVEVVPGRYLCISVTDTGTGMDDATLRRAFEPFFTTKERLKGTGLGLASVYTMVKASKGGGTLSSAPGKGTVVKLWIPEVDKDKGEAEAGAPAKVGSAGQTILVVEDETPLRNAMERILKAAGYGVFVAANADEAHAIFDRESGAIDLVLTDIIMPGRSGAKVAADFRLKKPTQKVLFVSGFTGDQVGVEGLGNLGLRLLRKPYNTIQLLAAVRDVLNKDVL